MFWSPDSVQHAGWGFAKPWRRSAFHRFPGQAFDDYAAETI